MATADVQLPQAAPTYAPTQTIQTKSATPQQRPHDVNTTLNYYKPNADGSPPHPTYVDRPETYDRPVEAHDTIVRDVTGKEKDYTLDGNGFQFHNHVSVEKDFLDDAQIKERYYPETEQLLKDAYVSSLSILLFRV